jgi:hypothetical protein
MFLLSNLASNSITHTVIAGVLSYAIVYMYFLMYDTDSISMVVMNFAPYFIIIDCILTAFLMYSRTNTKASDNTKTDTKTEKKTTETYIDMDDAINVYTLDQMYHHQEAYKHKDTLNQEIINEVYPERDYLEQEGMSNNVPKIQEIPEPILTQVPQEPQVPTPIQNPPETTLTQTQKPQETNESSSSSSEDEIKIVPKKVVTPRRPYRKTGKPTKKELAEREKLLKEMEDSDSE